MVSVVDGRREMSHKILLRDTDHRCRRIFYSREDLCGVGLTAHALNIARRRYLYDLSGPRIENNSLECWCLGTLYQLHYVLQVRRPTEIQQVEVKILDFGQLIKYIQSN